MRSMKIAFLMGTLAALAAISAACGTSSTNAPALAHGDASTSDAGQGGSGDDTTGDDAASDASGRPDVNHPLRDASQDASAEIAACQACVTARCQTGSQCRADPLCQQALADYVVCTETRPSSDCSKALENDSHVPGDITLCVPAFCDAQCTAQ